MILQIILLFRGNFLSLQSTNFIKDCQAIDKEPFNGRLQSKTFKFFVICTLL